MQDVPGNGGIDYEKYANDLISRKVDNLQLSLQRVLANCTNLKDDETALQYFSHGAPDTKIPCKNLQAKVWKTAGPV